MPANAWAKEKTKEKNEMVTPEDGDIIKCQ